MRRIVRLMLNWILPFLLFRLTQVDSKGLIEKVTSQGDLDLVILFDAGFKENKEKKRSKALENIAELAKNLLVEGVSKVNLTYVTYDSVSVQTMARADNRSAKGKASFSSFSSSRLTNGSVEGFRQVVMQTEMRQSKHNSNHLKALNYVGIKHFYDADDSSTKMIIMFINTDGIPTRDDTELNIVHYLLDRKNITLNIITKVNLKSYCHYLHKVGPNTNELLRCVLKNSFYHKLILTYTLDKLYDDIATNAKCSDWSEWSECTVTCNVGYHFSKRNTLHNVENPVGGKYKRTGKNCTDQRSLVIQECFETSCDNSLDVCDIEVDLSLLVNDSSNMSQDFWLKYVLKPIRNLIAHLNLSSKLVNVSLTTFSEETYNWVNFSSNLSRNRNELLLFLEHWRFNFGGPTNNLTSALNYMHHHVLNSNEGRPNAHKVLVIFNTGDVTNKVAKGAEEIVRNIKLIYAADVYTICLKNNKESNCEAISGATVREGEEDKERDANHDEATNSSSLHDAPFFYSYSNVSEFREQLSDIQKNICKNAHQAIVAARRRRRKNLRRADKSGEASGRQGRRTTQEGAKLTEREAHRAETKSADEAIEHAEEVEPEPEMKLDAVPGETPSEAAKIAQKLHGAKPVHIRPPYYLTSAGSLKGLKKNAAILKSFTNLDRIDDVEEEAEEEEKEQQQVDVVEPIQNPLKKYSSVYNIDALPSYKNKGKKNLICKLLKFLFRKKKEYKLKKMDPKDKEKIKQFIEEAKGLIDSEGTYHHREAQIEDGFKVMLDNIFKHIHNPPAGDFEFDSASVSSYGSYMEEGEELGLENTLPCSWFYIDAAQMNVDHMDGLTDADTVAGSNTDMEDDSDEEATSTKTGRAIDDDVSITDILVKEGGFATSENGNLKRRKRSVDQEEGQTTHNKENHGAKNEGPGGSVEGKGDEAVLPSSREREKKGEHDDRMEGGKGVDTVTTPTTTSSTQQSLPPDGRKPPTQKKFKSKFDIIQRFKNMAAVRDDTTGISFDEQPKYPVPPASNEGKGKMSHLEENTEGKKDDHDDPSAHIPNTSQRMKSSTESNKACDEGGVVPPLTPSMNYKKTEKNEATNGGGNKSNAHVTVDDNNPGMIKDKTNETLSGTKNETHAHDPNDQVPYDLLQHKDFTSEWDIGNYDAIEEEDRADSSIYKYSASFALIAVVLLGAAFLYIRSQKNLMEPVPVTFNDFVTHNGKKKVECREQHVELKPDETSWQ
ncbi:hypothetical protein AK88_02191 [Plasmodium fragile]|uniref:VWFA domain-containing protein n=1 Tax=Plasmodium fragile TaxID=5857 RepID=A0A0D9QMT6_PLAFR|nr:uncharacterized protein AK88_02191 [Plasmodium fragile]KJP88077.1 hypothetical protein AK88_02191 [Plasmodium fragile]